MDDEGVVDVQLHGGEDVLLGALVLHVVVEGPGEGDLRVVVDVAAHLQYSTVQSAQYSAVQYSSHVAVVGLNIKVSGGDLIKSRATPAISHH